MPKFRFAIALSIFVLLATACQPQALPTLTPSATPLPNIEVPTETPTAGAALTATPTPAGGDAATPPPAPDLTATSTTIPRSPPTLTLPPASCVPTLVPPLLASVNPATGPAGITVTISGSGGYLRDSCGGYNESARNFPLYFDGVEIASLGCYVNHCQVDVSIPTTTPPGEHCFAITETGCEVQFEVEQ